MHNYHTNVFEADKIGQKSSPQCHFTYTFLLFLFRSGVPPNTLLAVGVLTYPQLPAMASNVCTTDARLGGVGQVPPKTKILGTLVKLGDCDK